MFGGGGAAGGGGGGDWSGHDGTGETYSEIWPDWRWEESIFFFTQLCELWNMLIRRRRTVPTSTLTDCTQLYNYLD